MSSGKDNLAFVGSAALGRESLGVSFYGDVPPQLPADPSEYYTAPVEVYDVGDLTFEAPSYSRDSAGDSVYDDVPPLAEDRVYDVVVVGAGISGLYAARCLRKEGLDVLVVEARDRVGGRSFTQRDPAYGYVELGAGYFGTSQTKVIDLVKELGLELQALNPQGDAVLSLRGQTWLGDLDDTPSKNPFLLMDLNNVLRTLDKMTQKVPAHAPWLAEKAEQWDNISLADFITELSWSEMTTSSMKMAFSIIFGSRPEDISLLFALQFIRLGGGTRNLMSSKDGCQQFKMKGGTNQISERMAQELRGHIMLGSPVSAIHQYTDYVIVRTNKNKEYRCKRAIVACCPVLLKDMDFQPPIPTPQKAYLEHKAPGTIYKTFMFYEKAFWRTYGYKGEMICDSGIVSYCLEDIKSDGRFPALMGFLDGTLCSNFSKEERKKLVAKQYADKFDIPELNRPTLYIEKRWDDEDAVAFSGICVHSLPVGFLTKHRVLWGQQHQKVHFAGTEASLVYRGYMDGAVRAGEKAAKEVLDGLKRAPLRGYDTDSEEIPYIPRPFIQKVAPSVKQCLIFTAVIFVIIVLIVIGAIVSRVVQPQNPPPPTPRP